MYSSNNNKIITIYVYVLYYICYMLYYIVDIAGLAILKVVLPRDKWQSKLMDTLLPTAIHPPTVINKFYKFIIIIIYYYYLFIYLILI